jgi:hypothetical protein
VAWSGRADDTRDLVPFGIHALLVCDVVPSLHLPAERVTRLSPHGGPAEEAASGADRRADTRISRGRADGRAQSRPHGRPEDGSAGHVLVGGGRGISAGLLAGPLPADRVVGLE